MRILFIASARIPTERAMGTAIMKQCEGFAREGHVVTLVVPKRSGTATDDPFLYHRVEKIFTIQYIHCYDRVSASKILYYIRQVTFIFSLWRYVASHDADTILYSREPALLALLPTTKKKYIELHHFFGLRYFGSFLLKQFEGLITITLALKRDVVERFGYPQNAIHVAPSGVCLSDYRSVASKESVRHRLGIPPGATVALYVGEFDTWKGVETFLRAGASLVEQGVTPVVVGGSTSRITYFKEKYPHTLFLGRRPQSELPDTLQIADVLVVPNSAQYEISNRHTSPLKVFSYMASGIPIVATKTVANAEILHTHTASLVTPDDPDALGKEIIRVIADYSEAQERAKQARMDVAQYDWSSRTKGIIAFMCNRA